MSIEIKGLKEVIGNLNKYSARVAKEIDATLTDGANKIEERAKMLVPVDEGLLRGNIYADTAIPFQKAIVANTFYAPYIEFGTGQKFDGNGRDSIAAPFKGRSSKGGTFADFIKSMFDYIKRHKGFPPDVKSQAQKLNYTKFVCLRILRNGIKPQPFFYKAYDEIYPTIIQDLKAAIK
jgi:HK97 gp10 family phage protein